MIDKTDIDGIDRNYFDIIGEKDYGIVLRSQCTGHYWYLLEQEYNQHRTFQIYHRHHASNPYHLQKNKPTIEDCCEYIKDHDEYHLKKLKKKEEHRQKRLYWTKKPSPATRVRLHLRLVS